MNIDKEYYIGTDGRHHRIGAVGMVEAVMTLVAAIATVIAAVLF